MPKPRGFSEKGELFFRLDDIAEICGISLLEAKEALKELQEDRELLGLSNEAFIPRYSIH
ncbi:hypothetical protein CCP3SC5AM1_3320001 [Gammaproteobacteria bacterium]